MPGHIGIVGCSAEGAALCYRTVCTEAAEALGLHAHPEISLHTHSLADYVACLHRGDLDCVGRLMLSSAQKLQSIGAEILICPDNTIHQAFPFVAERSSARWLHIAEVVADEARRRGFRRVGILGTQWLVRSDVYPEKLEATAIEAVRPEDRDIAETNRIIMEELVNGVRQAASTAYLLEAIRRLAERGCDAVVLGCTELPLVLDDTNSPIPTLDSTRLLARAALKISIGDESSGV